MGTFNRTLLGAHIYQSSKRGKNWKAEDISSTNNQLEMSQLLPISASHIFTVLMYTNLDELQMAYKKYGCRPFDPDEDFEIFKKRHTEISHWYKSFYECVY